MRIWIITFILMVFCFFLPLQCFIIGNEQGLGVQGALYRYQMTIHGNSLIPITYEIGYITGGIYQGRTAASIILWVLGTLVLVWTTILSLISWNNISHRTFGFITIGIAVTGILYLASCITRYGPYFFGPAGICLPLGMIMLAMFAASMHYYRDLFFDTGK